MLEIGSLAAAALMILTGGFGTGALPLAERAGFWLLLMGWSALKWQIWFAWMVRKPGDWPRAALVGIVPLNLPLPVEIAWCARTVGVSAAVESVGTWWSALAISGIVLALFAAMRLLLWPRVKSVAAAAPDEGLLHRARIAPEALAAVEAEDHYCRVHRRDGASVLIHYRFGDALADLATLDGAQVHRGTWVAADAVEGAVREGRRWRLRLSDGSTRPVSATHLPAARARGWLSRR